MKTKIEAWQNGKVVLRDVRDLSEQFELSINKMKCIIQGVLGIYGYVEFKKVKE